MNDILKKSETYTMEDVNDYGHGIKSSGAESYRGHVVDVIGTESERDFKHSMSIPLTKIDPIAGIKTPDYINSEHDIVVEAYSGFIDKVDNRTSSEQVSTIHMNNHDIRDRIMEALRHARDKITPESLDYLQKNYGISSNPVCYAGYSMGSAMYLFIDSEYIREIISGVFLNDYKVVGLIVYKIPAGLGDMTYGGETEVYYQDDDRIDRTLFPKNTTFICVSKPTHRSPLII